MKNDLKRFEIADVQADCTVARLAGSFHPLAGVCGQRGWRAWVDRGVGAGRRRLSVSPPLDSRAFQ